MPTLMPKDTRDALGPNAEKCDSRSLFMDRFADPAAKDTGDHTPRRDWFKRLIRIPPALKSKAKWSGVLPGDGLLHAQLQSRLMVNMAGGVMENAGLCLDRFGLPYIPGSAVKGCARRAATNALLEAGTAEAKAEILFNLCLVFGWGDTEWKSGRKRKRERGQEVETEPHSDFWWAMAAETGDRTADDAQRNQMWNQVAPIVAGRLLDLLRVQKREHPNEPWLDLPNFAGSISFLPAYPVDLGKTGKVDDLPLEVPALGKLELDVVTVHHKQYYAEPAEPKDVPHSHEKWQRWKREHDAWEREWGTAPDIEEPVPNVFPAVAPGHVFTFALVPLRDATKQTENRLVKLARTWLKTGLEIFGLGAKTNAGYGWFADVTEAAKAQLERTSRKPNEALLGEFRGWDDKKVRAAARAFMFQNTKMWPQTGREATEDYQFTLVWFILNEKKPLFDAEKNYAGSDFAKGVKRLAEKFGIAIP